MLTQPWATVIAGAFVVIAAVIAFSGGVLQRRLEAKKHTFASRAEVYRDSLWEFQQVLDGFRQSVRSENEAEQLGQDFDADRAMAPVMEHFKDFQRANLMVHLVGTERVGEKLDAVYRDFVDTTLAIDPDVPLVVDHKFLEWESAMDDVRQDMRSDLSFS